MDWNLKALSWDLSEVDQANLPNMETMEGSSRYGMYRTKGEFSVDLKLGQVGNSGTERQRLVCNIKEGTLQSIPFLSFIAFALVLCLPLPLSLCPPLVSSSTFNILSTPPVAKGTSSLR